MIGEATMVFYRVHFPGPSRQPYCTRSRAVFKDPGGFGRSAIQASTVSIAPYVHQGTSSCTSSIES